MKKIELFSTLYLFTLGNLILITTLFSDLEYYNNIWYSLCYLSLMVSSVYFAISTKRIITKLALSLMAGQLFSATCFEVISMSIGRVVSEIDKPSSTFVWWAIALMATLSIAVYKNESRTN